jgi:hypothetical protein
MVSMIQLTISPKTHPFYYFFKKNGIGPFTRRFSILKIDFTQTKE